MKKLSFLLLSSFLVLNSLMASNPTGYLTGASFKNEKGENYFETYLTLKGETFRFIRNANNTYSGLAHVMVAFKLGDSTVASANYNISSPETADTLLKPDFINVKRYWLKSGAYTMSFSLDDPNSLTHETIRSSQTIKIGYRTDSVCISDAEFLTSFKRSDNLSVLTKCGYDLVPYVHDYYPEAMHELGFYCEIYNTAKVTGLHEKIQLKYSIVPDGNTISPSGYMGMTVQEADTVNPLMAQINIDNLPTGGYRLLVSVVDKHNHLLARRDYAFLRENPKVSKNLIPISFAPYMATRDTLLECLRCLYPIGKGGERSYVTNDSLQYVKTDELKSFFYNFWVARDSIHPLEAWQKYLLDVEAVNNSFGIKGIMKGYKTDRGRVYLQYGPPNQRMHEDMNPTSLPYEIWEYYTLPNGETDKKFVFYEPNLSTNTYVLLHSDATGEVQNPQWQLMLNSRLGTPNNIDEMNSPDAVGEHTLDNYANPH